MMALYGWTAPKMAGLSTKSAIHRRLAKAAAGMPERTAEEQSIPAPSVGGAGAAQNIETSAKA
jgi:hypothetical protein